MDTLVTHFGEGIHPDVSPEDYYNRVLGEANNGTLGILLEGSPTHYRYWVDQPPTEERTAYREGRAYHCALLEPQRFERDFVTMPDWGPLRSGAAKEEARIWHEQHRDKTPLSRAERIKVLAMADAVRMHPLRDERGRQVALLGDLLEEGLTEVTTAWIDPETGLHCKARHDFWSKRGRFSLDPKSTRRASKEAFARAVNEYRYHVQHTHYADGHRVLGEPLDKFWFLAQEKDPPYAVGLYTIGAASEERGFELRQRAMRQLADCLERDRWPSYNDDQAAMVNIPAYGMYD